MPKAGAPLFMSTLEVKPPYITGAPGRTICTKARPASASAFCWTRAPARLTGAIAPARVKGVIATGWLRRASSIIPHSIGASYCNGELTLTKVNTLASRSNSDSLRPRMMRVISSPSRMRCRPSE